MSSLQRLPSPRKEKKFIGFQWKEAPSKCRFFNGAIKDFSSKTIFIFVVTCVLLQSLHWYFMNTRKYVLVMILMLLQFDHVVFMGENLQKYLKLQTHEKCQPSSYHVWKYLIWPQIKCTFVIKNYHSHKSKHGHKYGVFYMNLIDWLFVVMLQFVLIWTFVQLYHVVSFDQSSLCYKQPVNPPEI